MSHSNRRLQLDLDAARYLDALERDDFTTMEKIWSLALADPELDAVLREVHAGLIEEQARGDEDTSPAALTETVNEGLAQHRSALLLLARAQLARHQQLRLDASDLVQQTYVEAYRDVKQFRGGTDAERFAWLRMILHRNFLDAYNRQRAGKRDLARQALEADLTKSFAGLDELLVAEQTSPSEGAVRNEDLTRLAEALERLPEDQREAVTLKHLVGLTLAQISERMGSTSAAVAGLLYRGRIRLRELLA